MDPRPRWTNTDDTDGDDGLRYSPPWPGVWGLACRWDY